MIELLGHIPREGEKARVGQHDMTVLLAEPTRIRKLLIERIIPAPEARPTDSEAGA
jgi:CBS domain containing-hemolysin-like protein